MKRVKVLTPFFAEQTSTHYTLGAEVDVPENLFERHNAKGTGFLEEVPSKEKAKPKAK